MKLGVLLSFCISFSFTFSKEKEVNVLKPDSAISQIFREYEQALVTRNVDFPEKWFVSDKEYRSLLMFVKDKQPNCVGPDEEAFDTQINKKVYEELITSNVTIDKVSVSRIDYNNSCGNLLEIPRVVCTIRYAGKKMIEVPFLMVRTLDNKYKILKSFLNYKLLSNEQ
jgi:hypothetical protein